MFNRKFKEDILRRLEAIEDRLASDRRAVPVLKDVVKIMTKENTDLKDRLMARNFEEYKIYKTVETPTGHFSSQHPTEDLDDQFAGEVVDLDRMIPNPNEVREP